MVSGTVEALERWYSRVSIKVSLSAPHLLCEKYRDRYPDLGPVSRKSRELFGPEKAFVKLRTGYSVKLVFSYVINRSQIKIAAKFRASRGLRFEDTKRIMSPEMRPKSFGTFEKQVPVPERWVGLEKSLWLQFSSTTSVFQLQALTQS